MKKHQIIIKGIYYNIFLFYLTFIIKNIFFACAGIKTTFWDETEIDYGISAMSVFSIIHLFCLWWLYIAAFIFQIIIIIHIIRHPEWKKLNFKYYLKNPIFYVPFIIYIFNSFFIDLFLGLFNL